MQLQAVFRELESRGWYRIDQTIKLENLTDFRLYAHDKKPGVIITLVGTPDMYVGPSALANIYAQAEIDPQTSESGVEISSQSASQWRKRS